jgi:hypothetical protein
MSRIPNNACRPAAYGRVKLGNNYDDGQVEEELTYLNVYLFLS